MAPPDAVAAAGCPWRWHAARDSARVATSRPVDAQRPARQSPRSRPWRARNHPDAGVYRLHQAKRRRGPHRPRPGQALVSTYAAPRAQPATTGRARAAADSGSGVPRRTPADGSTDSGAPLPLRSMLCGRRAKSRPNATLRTHGGLLTRCETPTTYGNQFAREENSTIRARRHKIATQVACQALQY
jgi:hypothetical protein